MREVSTSLVGLMLTVAATDSSADHPHVTHDEKPQTTVVVTGIAPDAPLTFITDPKLPRQPVPASDGADYLKTIPGFSAIRNGGTNGDPVLRGMFGSRLNVLTNDGAMPGACPGRMDNPLSYVAPETYDRLIVIKGPQTVLWGAGASAGTVRFERDPLADKFEEPGLRMHANALGGSFNRNDQLLDVTAGADVGYARVSANRSEADDYEDGDGRKVPSAWEKWNADVALGWTPADDTVVELSAGGGDGEARYATRALDGSQFERTSYGARFEKGGMTGFLKAVEANLFYNHADHLMDNYTLRNSMAPRASNVDRRTTGGRVAATWEMASLKLIAGADTQESRHRKRAAPGRGAYAQLPWQTDAEFANVGSFAELTWQAHDAGRAVVGARIDRAEVSDRRTAPTPTAGQTREETLTNGFIRYERDAGDAPLSWFAGVGHAERMPDYWELFSPSRGPIGSLNAFAAVEPEQTSQLDIGVQYRTPRFDTWVSAYAGRVDDFILFTYAGSSSVDQVDARIRGAEAGVEFRPMSQWTLGASLAYSWAENQETGAALPQIPPLDARFTLAYNSNRWSAGALLRVVDGQNRVSIGQGNVVGRDIGESSGFAVLSMNGTYRLSSDVSINAGVDNLLDRTYTEHLNLAGSAEFGYPADPLRINEPGRTAWLKIIWGIRGR